MRHRVIHEHTFVSNSFFFKLTQRNIDQYVTTRFVSFNSFRQVTAIILNVSYHEPGRRG